MSDWESDDGDYDRKMAERNWNRLQDTHGTLGYTEGLVEGKDAHIQRGFDDGYESAAIIARELGRMRGILECLVHFYPNATDANTLAEKIHDLKWDTVFSNSCLKENTHEIEMVSDITNAFKSLCEKYNFSYM